jgi:hypothetical protein
MLLEEPLPAEIKWELGDNVLITGHNWVFFRTYGRFCELVIRNLNCYL